MTGLDLETFLRLARVDYGAWLTFGAIVVLVALMAWTSFGTRRALKKCLALSVIAHLGLVLAGGSIPVGFITLRPGGIDPTAEHIREIRVTPEVETSAGAAGGSLSPDGKPGRRLADWDRPGLAPAPDDPALRPARREAAPAELVRRDATPATPIAPADAQPEINPPEPARAENRSEPTDTADAETAPARSAPADAVDLPKVAMALQGDAQAAPAEALPTPEGRPRPGRMRGPDAGPSTGAEAPVRPADRPNLPTGPDLLAAATIPPSAPSAPPLDGPGDTAPRLDPESRPRAEDDGGDGGGLRRVPARAELPQPALPEDSARVRPGRPKPAGGDRGRPSGMGVPVPIARATPSLPGSSDLAAASRSRPLPEVPEVYRPRLDPNRSTLAQRAGASRQSEEAVERALVWLARHQDNDGRWDGAAMKSKDGTPLPGQDDFTVHCPAGETCFGECYYWEADTALTGLALLSYLGAGYTHLDGKHAAVVDKGLRFLLTTQKADGDLRGDSIAVGMYCHAMASLAICEAYALTGDATLRGPAERAVGFLVRARATDGMAWRYEPGARSGDTSILGWVILVLKSANEVGIPVPADVRAGTARWLALVADGNKGGLAAYRPNEKVTPTMTAEAWVCRQFLGVGGPGAASSEAAEYLLAHGPKRDVFNLYYWYYGTLAMYQHGGAAWTRWNAEVRDGLVDRQRTGGHQAGSWDPDESEWGTRGGRIYCTAVATLTLEVYYRYLRLYDQPGAPPVLAPRRPGDGALRRAGGP